MAEGIIYMYTSPSGRSYIGQTVNEKNRKAHHKTMTSRDSDFAIYRAFRKYGYDKFKYKRLCTITASDNVLNDILNRLEIFYIKYYNTFKEGYNETIGGLGTKSRPHSIEVRELMSKRAKELIIERGEAHHLHKYKFKKGQRMGTDTPNYGKYKSEHPGAKRVLDITTGETHGSLLDLADELGVKDNTAWKWLNGRGSRRRDFIYIDKKEAIDQEYLSTLREQRLKHIEEDKIQLYINKSTPHKRTKKGKPRKLKILNVFTGQVYDSIEHLAESEGVKKSAAKDWAYGRGSRKHEFEYIKNKVIEEIV